MFQNFGILETMVKYLEINEILISIDPRLIFIKGNTLCWKKLKYLSEILSLMELNFMPKHIN